MNESVVRKPLGPKTDDYFPQNPGGGAGDLNESTSTYARQFVRPQSLTSTGQTLRYLRRRAKIFNSNPHLLKRRRQAGFAKMALGQKQIFRQLKVAAKAHRHVLKTRTVRPAQGLRSVGTPSKSGVKPRPVRLRKRISDRDVMAWRRRMIAMALTRKKALLTARLHAHKKRQRGGSERGQPRVRQKSLQRTR